MVALPSVSYALLAELLTTPSLPDTDRLGPVGAQGTPLEAVPHPLWLARVNESCPSTPEVAVMVADAVPTFPCVSVTETTVVKVPGLT